MLAASGFVAGNGGCAQNTYSEDCNNNGELDTALVLTHVDANGVTSTITINEDMNNNGKLDLIDRLPRENSIDGRQMRYVYGGRNGSTRLMDIHFQVGMHCIDCHFLQDVHGDGHVYSTNWDHIEIECEDCHGAKSKATLLTSGPTGGNDLTKAHDANLVPYFENKGGQIIQHSRVTPGLTWVVPQTVDQTSALAIEAHSMDHIGGPGEGSTFAGTPGASKITQAKVECATCHSSWIHNCVGCHVNANIGDTDRTEVTSDLKTLDRTPKENEIWFTNQQNEGHIDFQLLGLLRAPFVLGVSGSSEQGRLATFRSSMQALVSVTDGNGNSLRDNQTFTTFQAIDGNSKRTNVATSGVAMNQTMPHTTRPSEARGCETCHALLDAQGRGAQRARDGGDVRPRRRRVAVRRRLGDGRWHRWPRALRLQVRRRDRDEQEGHQEPVPRHGRRCLWHRGARSWPRRADLRRHGRHHADLDRGRRRADPQLQPDAGDGRRGAADPRSRISRSWRSTRAPATARLLLSKISHARQSERCAQRVGRDKTSQFVLPLPAPARALAHIAPDVSDPFVYVAVGAAGVAVVHIDNVPSASGGGPATLLIHRGARRSGHTANELQRAGDFLYVGTVEGTIDVLDLSDPQTPSRSPARLGAASARRSTASRCPAS